ncbi:MAG: toxin TcdB middle/N-terminal domain-containing protein [Bryobacteraceae bacterium]
MSKSSGTADEILNLPSGGGSVSGAGTGFSVDLNTGTLSAGLDLTLPAGPNGILPQISIQYSSGNGDGPFGMGWSLGTLMILRKISPSADPPDPTAPGYYSMSGVGDLVDMGSGRYRPTVDTTGQLIEFANGSWTVTDNRDNFFTLGTTPSSQIGSNPPAAWLLDSSSDSSGNVVKYTWLNDSGSLLPNTATWGTYQLVFLYEARPDLLVNGAYGAPIRTTQRCNAIELHVTTEAVSLVRSWQLLYDDDNGLGRSFLATIREQGHAADGTILAAPDRTFGYTTAGSPAFVPVTGFTSPLNDSNTDLVDLNGDGLPDILKLGGGLPTMSPNLGGGRFGFPRTLSQAPSSLRLSSANVAFADMSGAGNADLLVLDQPFAGYYPLSTPNGTAPAGFAFPVVFQQAPNVLPGDPNVRLLDLNGDGITDVLYDTGRAWLEYLREGVESWSNYPIVLPAGLTPPVSLSDPHVYLADMTGDGYTDIVFVNGGGVTYWPARADGGWDAPISMSPGPAPALDQEWEPLRLALFDVDGDGCADLVYVGDTNVTVWLNTGANRLSAPITINNTPLATPGSYRLVDLLGVGTTGIHFELPQVRVGQIRQTFLDLTGGVKPDLLCDIGNGPGQTTHITYLPSTHFASEDARSGARWPTYHPFPVQCVAQTDQTDLGTGLTATIQYQYHDGRYDPGTRVWLGFGRVDSYQLGDATCPTLKTETVFHLGLDPNDPSRPLTPDEAFQLGALRRKVLSTTVCGLDGSTLEQNPYSVVTNTYATMVIPSGLGNGGQVALPYTTNTTEERWERQATVLSTRVIQYLAITDEGDITQQRTTATRTGMSTPDQDVITLTTYATGGRNIRMPARVTQTAADGTVIGANITYYDGDPYVGLPEGQATAGLETRIEDLVFTAAFVTQIWGASPPDLTAYGYHQLTGDTTNWWMTRRAQQRGSTATGPLLSTKGPLGAIQTVQLDSAGQRAIAVTDAMGNVVSATINARVWQTESVTDQNNLTTTDVFDALGRVTATIHPLDTAALPFATFEFSVGAISTVTGSARINHGQPEVVTSISFINGLGASLGKANASLTPGQWVVTQSVARNRRGMVTQTYLPYQITGTAWQAAPAGTSGTSLIYDALGRVVQKTRADGLIVSTRREGDTQIFSEQWPGGAPTDVEQQTFDAAGQLLSVNRLAGDHWVEQTYQYAPSGRANLITLPGGAQVSLVYDLMGRRFSHQSPDTGATVYLLDALGNERLRTLATGQQVRTEVDAANRVTQIFHDAEATPRIVYAYYDEGGPVPADGITANRAGRVWQITDELGAVTLQYEASGRIVNSTRVVAASGASFSEEYTYDDLGRTISTTLPSTTTSGPGRTVNYSFGLDGRLASASGMVESATYDIIGRPTAIQYANGAQTNIEYRPNGGTLSRVQVIDSTGTTVRDVSVSVSQALVTGVSSATSGDDSAAFTYDGLKRLTAADYTQGATALDAHSWSYDDTFTVATSSDAGPLTYVAGTHQLASIAGTAVTYDAAGRMSSGRFGGMVFDSSDHLSQVTAPGGQIVAHTYAYSGLRVQTVSQGSQSYLAPTDNFVVKGGQSVAWLSFGPLRLAAEVNGALFFLHTDVVGNMDLITDASGLLAGRVQLTPYGLARPASGSPATGGASTVAVLLSGVDITGLVCQGQRWYDPLVAQFVSPDPFVSSIYTIGAWNPYLYCLGNPIALSDPAGCNFWTILEIIGIAILAAACVVGAIWTGGATLVALGVLTANLSTGLLVGVSIGALGGAIAGELAAQKAGGSIWAGAFMGALLGGVSSLAGGVLGAMVGTALKALPLLAYVATGAVQGVIAGIGTGLAVGYAGGKGTAEQMLMSAVTGAAWGATLGAILGLGSYFLVGNPPTPQPGQPTAQPYLQIGNILNKYDPEPAVQDSLTDQAGAVDNQLGLVNDLMQLGTKPSAGNALGLIPDFIGTQYVSGNVGLFLSNGSLVNIPLGWVPAAALNGGLFAAAVNVSFAADQAGFSYADQISLLFKGAPWFVDLAETIFQEINPNNDYGKAANAFNQAFGSANSNEFS